MWTHTCILVNLLRGRSKRNIEGRLGEEERMKDEDREQIRSGRERQKAGEIVRKGESPPFGSIAGVSFMSSMPGSEALSPSWA